MYYLTYFFFYLIHTIKYVKGIISKIYRNNLQQAVYY